ncbi:MAG: ribonuclease HI family protein [Candidatus Omnitrophota bacterium]|jgi:ribonuclease HI
MKELTIYIDGASKGNPGHSGIGVIIWHNGRAIKDISHYIGLATNNIAEYTAFIYGLQECLLLKAESVDVYTDSELLFRQIRKVYKVKNQNIQVLYGQALRLMAGFKNFTIQHIPREQNQGADALATKAVKEALKK